MLCRAHVLSLIPASPSASSPVVPMPVPRCKSRGGPSRLQMFSSSSVGYPLTSIPGSRDGRNEEAKDNDSAPASSAPPSSIRF